MKIVSCPEVLNVPNLTQYRQKDICIENPNGRFTEIVGFETVKGLLKEFVLLPLKISSIFHWIARALEGSVVIWVFSGKLYFRGFL